MVRRELGVTKVPTGPVAEHVRALREAGLGWARIGHLAGVAPIVVRDTHNYDHMLIKNARAIMGVPLPGNDLSAYTDNHRVSVIGTRRRLQALIAMGYTNYYLASELGYSNVSLHGPLFAFDTVTVSRAKAVRELFDRLSMVPPPPSPQATKAQRRAKKYGWAPPLAWDDDDIDDPDAEPQMPKGDKHDWLEDYLELREMGKTHEEIARRMGINNRSLTTRLWRLNHEQTANSDQEHEQVREDHEQMVRADRQGMAPLRGEGVQGRWHPMDHQAAYQEQLNPVVDLDATA